jgi:hypothetical protein
VGEAGEAVERRVARLYELFNARDVDALLETLAPDVNWPNAVEGGRLLGRDAVREYWRGQFASFDPRVRPLAVRVRDDDRVEVRVHQVVNDLNGDLIGQGEVLHVYEFEDRGLVMRMEIEEVGDERTVPYG